MHAVLRNALQHAMREELVSRNVAKLVRIPSPRYKVGKGLSVDQVRKILDTAAGRRAAPRSGRQDRRLGGGVAAARGHLAHSSRTPGTAAGRAAALAEVWEDRDLVFPSERGTPMEPTNLSRSFARLRETAGLPGVRLHDLRHTVVSLLMELGVPPHVVQAIARQADVKITLKVYAHANLDAMRQALGKLNGKLS
ncbi:tyrosine-type recombinase/integrase [Micromonospora zamorensis]|uniref:tyrosine-type recombinase/integrase n=1 Tax=Micromonospora zamorensis TaxID=709883 RepID=UPI002E2D2816|nr:tyrosine-type recombinase/integrase [Micromonospora zamorensis]